MEKAAQNPSGGASEGVGMGIGFAMAQQMMQQMNQPQTAVQGAPPPLPSQVSYFVAKDGQSTGPFDLNLIMDGIKSGHIASDALIWKTGLANWVPASTLTELNAAFNTTPPPIPPSK